MTGTSQILFGQEAISLIDSTPANVTFKTWHIDHLSHKQSIIFFNRVGTLSKKTTSLRHPL